MGRRANADDRLREELPAAPASVAAARRARCAASPATSASTCDASSWRSPRPSPTPSCTPTTTARGTVELQARRAPYELTLVVRDHGCGIAARERPAARASGSPIIRRLAQHVELDDAGPGVALTMRFPRGGRWAAPCSGRDAASCARPVGDEPPVEREPRDARARARRASSSPSAASRAAAAPCRASSARPSREPQPSMRPLQRAAAPASSRSRPAAGEPPAASALGVARRVQHVPPAHAADVRVRAGPEAPPVVRAPVADVVAQRAAASAAQLEISYQRSPRAGERGVGRAVAARLHVVVGRAAARRGAPARAGASPARRSARRR